MNFILLLNINIWPQSFLILEKNVNLFLVYQTEVGEKVSIAESLKATAEAVVLQQSGFVYDENSGLYYDYNSGYYYDNVSTCIFLTIAYVEKVDCKARV